MEQRLVLVAMATVVVAALLPMNNSASITKRDADCPGIVSREEWGAKPPKERENITQLPVPFVILHHTYIPSFCNSSDKCKADMRSMQKMHQDVRGWFDIGYSFCVGGTGLVYEGRGWNVVGAHAPRYNNRSVGICFIGDFMEALPTEEMMDAAKELIKCGIERGSIASNYTLLGHRQVRDTLCPGDMFYENITTWRHYKNIHDVQPYHPPPTNATQPSTTTSPPLPTNATQPSTTTSPPLPTNATQLSTATSSTSTTQ
ncbi:peptidoglycan-recognition protein LB-like isoform X2 [Periplaneta americana]|uniref:peptidoglycan-recognition protein LB-like isoform X2 n=1 Tax=Periplaneta americana TaxID=6978 RepID=UPI0037E8F2C8